MSQCLFFPIFRLTGLMATAAVASMVHIEIRSEDFCFYFNLPGVFDFRGFQAKEVISSARNPSKFT